MDFMYTPKRRMLRKALQDFLSQECTSELIRYHEEREEFPFDLYRKFAALGMVALPFPEDYGGKGGDTFDLVVLNEEVARYGGSMMMALTGTAMFALASIASYGSEEQKREYLPGVARGEIILAFALTEPEAGSDAASLTTSAVLDGDDYVINGTKMFCTRAHVSHYIVIVTRTDPTVAKHRGLSIFLMDRQTPGVTIRPLKKLGHWAVQTNEIVLKNARVPGEMMLGAPNEGWKNLLKHLNVERIVTAAGSIGLATGAFELALAYAKERVQFGQPIGKFQVIQHYIADMATRIEAARSLLYRAAWMETQGMPCGKETAMAKYVASEATVFVANKGMQIMGGYGYMMEHDMQRYYRECRLQEIAPGSTEIQKNIIARELGL